MAKHQSIVDAFDAQAKIQWPTNEERAAVQRAWEKYCLRFEPTLDDSLGGTWTLRDCEALSRFQPLAGEANGYVLLFDGFGIHDENRFFPYRMSNFLRVATRLCEDYEWTHFDPDTIFIAFRDDFVFAENVYDEHAVVQTVGVTKRGEPFFGRGSIERLYAAHPKYVRECGYHGYGQKPYCFRSGE
jgi:hypothetical protein